ACGAFMVKIDVDLPGAVVLDRRRLKETRFSAVFRVTKMFNAVGFPTCRESCEHNSRDDKKRKNFDRKIEGTEKFPSCVGQLRMADPTGIFLSPYFSVITSYSSHS